MAMINKRKNQKNTYTKALKHTLSFFHIDNNIGVYSLKDGSINLCENNGKWKVSCIDRNRESYCSYYQDENEACKRVLELYSKSKIKLWLLTLFYTHSIQ